MKLSDARVLPAWSILFITWLLALLISISRKPGTGPCFPRHCFSFEEQILTCANAVNFSTFYLFSGYEYDEAVRMGFMRLFKYIEGENEKKEKIPMTAPVAVIIQPGQGPFCKNNFTVNFFVPFEDQTDPAAPTNKEVFISTQPKFCAYVISYGGYSNINDIQKYSEELDEALVKDGLGDTYRKDIFFYAGYDSPFRVFDRHNELWFIEKESEYVKF